MVSEFFIYIHCGSEQLRGIERDKTYCGWGWDEIHPYSISRVNLYYCQQ
jgi:hypothetical protein